MSAAYRGKTNKSMGKYTRTIEEEQALKWCYDNNICITPRQAKWGERTWVIDIEKGLYPNRVLIGTSKAYGPNTIWQKVSEYQLYYYKKYAK